MDFLSFYNEVDELVGEEGQVPVLAEREGLPMLGRHVCEHLDGHFIPEYQRCLNFRTKESNSEQ